MPNNMINHTLNLDLDTDRHLVVGDIHGHYDAFMRLLDKVNYDPSTDIIYSVGDLIDRGPDSVKVVDFFLGDRRYAIKGNHEHMMLSPREWFDVWVSNGGYECITDLERHNRSLDWLKDVIAPMPWVIDVGRNDEEHAFRIVHAEMPPAWSEQHFQRVLREALNADDPSFAHLIWSRKTVQKASDNLANMRLPHTGINFHENRFRRVFAGHTPVKNAFKCKDIWYLDTKFGGTMTMIDAITEQRYKVSLYGQ